jgi:hypothetical protein
MANECTPLFDPADAITVFCEAAIIGKRFIKISGPAVDGLTQVSPCGAGEQMLGVAHRDAALGAKGGTYRIGVIPVKAGEAIAAGDPIASGAAGVAMIATPGAAQAGWALDDAALNADCFVIMAISPAGDVLPPSAAVADLVHAAVAGAAADSTMVAIPAPADAPATADALRDDLVANALPAIRDNFEELAAKVNTILARMRTRGDLAA